MEEGRGGEREGESDKKVLEPRDGNRIDNLQVHRIRNSDSGGGERWFLPEAIGNILKQLSPGYLGLLAGPECQGKELPYWGLL